MRKRRTWTTYTDVAVLKFDFDGIYPICCCDCGLVHMFEFTRRRGGITLTARRDNRSTAGLRRYRDYECKGAK